MRSTGRPLAAVSPTAPGRRVAYGGDDVGGSTSKPEDQHGQPAPNLTSAPGGPSGERPARRRHADVARACWLIGGRPQLRRATARPVRATSRTVWLCRPGQSGDPCAYSRTATSVTGSGGTRVVLSPTARSASRYDCFYVYPTVSTESGTNADLTVQPAETAAAISQASRFSQVCNVWAPMYRQATSRALARGQATNPAVVATAYGSLLSAWKDYLAHDNHGRPIVFIGHSQGAAMLIKLLQTQVDPSPRLRKRMLSAIILGGNVQVPTGKTVGGSFKNIPTCGSASQTGCVIAYSSFGSMPPATSFFARPGQRREPAIGADGHVGSAGRVRQPRDLLVGHGQPAALLPHGGARPKGVRGADALGDVPGPLHRPVPAERRGIVAPGDHAWPQRVTRGRPSRRPSGPTGAITSTTSTWPWATWSSTSPTRRRPTSR